MNETWKSIVERSWADPKFRQDLLDNPNQVLAAAGVAIPSGVNFVVVENEPTRLHLVLPVRPGEELTAPDAGGDTLSEYQAAIII